ncbi:MAG: hypothetical protein U5L72_02685, partial [Bacteroidales bacterium]|nr:hypothetical protein [Bacteroidales bacterium]
RCIAILPAEAFWIGAGLNFQRRAEMRTEQRTGMAGFSAGFGFRTRAFELSFGHMKRFTGRRIESPYPDTQALS